MYSNFRHISFILIMLVTTIQGPAQDGYLVKDIRFTGNHSFSDEMLSEQVAMHGIDLIDRYIFSKDPYYFSEEILQGDLERLVRFYQREGFLNAEAKKSAIKLDHDNSEIDRLTINIKEGTPIRVKKISFDIDSANCKNYQITDSLINTVRQRLTLKSGMRFRDEAIHYDWEKLVEYFNDEGYAYTKVDYQLNLKDTTNTVDVRWMINAGPLCYFGAVQIKGMENVSESLIRRQLYFEKGQIYDQHLLDKTQAQIYELGLFQIVTVNARKEQQHLTDIAVDIQVREAPRFTSRFGFGYGSEDNFRAFADLRHLGFFGSARRLELLVKYSGLEPYNINLKWIQPQFLSRKTSISLNPFLRRETEPGFSARRYGINVPLHHKFNSKTKGSVTYFLEDVQQDYDADNPDFKNRAVKDYNYYKSGLIFGSNWDSSEPVFSPIRGFFASVSYKLIGQLMPSDFNYNRLLIDLRNYRNFFYNITGAMRVKWGTIISADDDGFIPAEDRFYSGGSMSVRGWSRSELGPLQENGDPLGGKSLLETSFELRHPLYKIVSAAIFADFGNVWQTSNTYKLDQLRYSAGFGIRIETPIAPVRLDFAWPIDDRNRTGQIHINVGQAF